MTSGRLHIIVLCRAVAPIHGVGGLERHVNDMVRHLLKREVKVTLITRPPAAGQSAAAELDHPNLTLLFVPYWTIPFAGRRGTTIIDRSSAYPLFGWRAGTLAADLVRRGGVQIVHGLGAASLGYARARTADWYGTVPFIFNPQGMEEFGSTGAGLSVLKHFAYSPLRRAVRACARAADRTIATDRALVPTVRKHLGVADDAIAVVPNGVDLDELDRLTSPDGARKIRERLGLGAEDVLLVGVGRLEENKGFHHLVSALGQLSAAGSARKILGDRWRCVILGNGPYRPTLERQIAAAGLGEFIVLPGRVTDPELHAWYEAATLFVHPSLYEGSSIVTLEAMAHRRTIVATRAGGIPDKVRPGENGWLVDPGDVTGLLDALKQALVSRDRFSVMGRESRGIVEREFAWDSIAERLLALYAEVRSQRGAINHRRQT